MDNISAGAGCYCRRRAGWQNRRSNRSEMGHPPDGRTIRHVLAHPTHDREHRQHIRRPVHRRDRRRGGLRPRAGVRGRNRPGVDSRRPRRLLPPALLLGDHVLVCGGRVLLLRGLQHRLLRDPGALRPGRALHAGVADVAGAEGPQDPGRQGADDSAGIALRRRRGDNRPPERR